MKQLRCLWLKLRLFLRLMLRSMHLRSGSGGGRRRSRVRHWRMDRRVAEAPPRRRCRESVGREMPRERRPGRATPGCAARMCVRVCAAKTGHAAAHFLVAHTSTLSLPS